MKNASLSDDVLYRPLVGWTMLFVFSFMWYMIQPMVVTMEMEVIALVWAPCIVSFLMALYTFALSSFFTLLTRYIRRKGFTGYRHPFTEMRMYKVAYMLPVVYVLGIFGTLFVSESASEFMISYGLWIVLSLIVGAYGYMAFKYSTHYRGRIVSRKGDNVDE